MAVIAFDFDRTLTNKKLQKLARKLIQERNDVWIVTARRDNEFNRKAIEPILHTIKLSIQKVLFSDEKPKIELLEAIRADLYFDNISTEFKHIMNCTNTIPVLFYD